MLPLATGCGQVGGEGTCFIDEHCPAGLACIEGMCLEPQAGSSDDGGIPEGVKLDAGGDAPEIPATCGQATTIRTSAGCEFWAADLPNAWLPSKPYAEDIASKQQFAVVVANVSDSQVARVSVYSGGSNKALETRTVHPLRTATFNLPAQSLDPTRNGGGKAYRIESDIPITAYQFQPLDNLVPVYSNDATALLPTHVLEDDYIALTSDGMGLTLYPDGFDPVGYNAGAFVTVVATANDTQVVFHPTTELAEGAWQGVTLNKGDAFTIISDVYGKDSVMGDPYGNLSGTRVIASKPVALFSGNVTAREPRNTTECCVDHVEHQMLPLVAWGHRYIVTPPPSPQDVHKDAPAVYRLTAAFDDTELTWGGNHPDGAPSVLNAGETAYFLAGSAVVVSSDPDHPIAIAQFLLNSGDLGSKRGDPAMIVPPAIEQFQSRYVFLTPFGYRDHAVNLVAPRGITVEVDGKAVTGWKNIAGSDYAKARVVLDPGAHVVVAEAPVEITVYGYDDYVSYGYSGGSAVEKISERPPIP